MNKSVFQFPLWDTLIQEYKGAMVMTMSFNSLYGIHNHNLQVVGSIKLAFNSLYGIPNLFAGFFGGAQTRLSIPLMGYYNKPVPMVIGKNGFQFPLWDTYTWYYKGKRTVYFQFPLWDTEKQFKVSIRKKINFQFPLWDTKGIKAIKKALRLDPFQFPLWDTLLVNCKLVNMMDITFNSLYGILRKYNFLCLF